MDGCQMLLVQVIRFNPRGFRNFGNCSIRILYFCGKSELCPQ